MREDWRRGRCQSLWQEQQGLCFFCERPMPAPATQRLRHRKHPDSATIEHVVPRALGGLEEWENEVVACRICNSAKADRLPTEEELTKLEELKRR